MRICISRRSKNNEIETRDVQQFLTLCKFRLWRHYYIECSFVVQNKWRNKWFLLIFNGFQRTQFAQQIEKLDIQRSASEEKMSGNFLLSILLLLFLFSPSSSAAAAAAFDMYRLHVWHRNQPWRSIW